MRRPGTNGMILVLATVTSGILYFFSTGLDGFRALVWIAPLPVLLVSMRYSRRFIMVGAFCAYATGGLNLVGYLSRLAPMGVVIGSILIPAIAFAVIVVAYRDAILHLRHPLAFLAFPVGWIRLSTPVSGEPVRVGLVAIDSTVEFSNTTESEKALDVLGAYGRVVANLADRGAQIVILPEKLVGVTEGYEREVFAFLSGLARQKNVVLIAGLNRIGAEPHRNLAVVISSDGTVLGEYDKRYPIPGLETGYRTGLRTFQFTTTNLSAGIAICKDMDFHRWIRHYGDAGTSILFVPAWDFSSDAWLHSHMAVMRAVENGFALVRSANNGFLTVTDDRGRVIGEASSSSTSPVSLLSDVRPGTGRTFYTRAGDWFAWLDLFFLLVLVVAVSRRLARRLSHNNS